MSPVIKFCIMYISTYLILIGIIISFLCVSLLTILFSFTISSCFHRAVLFINKLPTLPANLSNYEPAIGGPTTKLKWTKGPYLRLKRGFMLKGRIWQELCYRHVHCTEFIRKKVKHCFFCNIWELIKIKIKHTETNKKNRKLELNSWLQCNPILHKGLVLRAVLSTLYYQTVYSVIDSPHQSNYMQLLSVAFTSRFA